MSHKFCEVISHFKININLNYVGLSPYRAVNTLFLVYKNRSENAREIIALCSKIPAKCINAMGG
jgi:hypothetical protein